MLHAPEGEVDVRVPRPGCRFASHVGRSLPPSSVVLLSFVVGNPLTSSDAGIGLLEEAGITAGGGEAGGGEHEGRGGDEEGELQEAP